MDRNPRNLIPTQLSNNIVQFYCYTTIGNKTPYNWPACSQQVLSSICIILLEYVTKGHIVTQTILF